MTVQEVVERRHIEEVVHFTRHSGLMGALHSGYLKSRQRLPEDAELRFIYEPNAIRRKDQAWLDYVNLSLSQINYGFFEICRDKWHCDEDLWWCVLSFDPVILTHPGVLFATTNNMYTSSQRYEGGEGLERLFSSIVPKWPGESARRAVDCPPCLTTCPQAEALYPEQLSLEFLRRIYVARGEHKDEVHAQLASVKKNVEVIVAPERLGLEEELGG